MKKVKGIGPQGDPWSLDIPDRGWMIEGLSEERNIVEYAGDKAFQRAQDPGIHNDNQVYWTKEAAEQALKAMVDPVGYAADQYRQGKISALELSGSVGDLHAAKIING